MARNFHEDIRALKNVLFAVLFPINDDLKTNNTCTLRYTGKTVYQDVKFIVDSVKKSDDTCQRIVGFRLEVWEHGEKLFECSWSISYCPDFIRLEGDAWRTYSIIRSVLSEKFFNKGDK